MRSGAVPFEVEATRAFYRPQGRATPGEVADGVAAFLRRARDEGLCEVVVDVSRLSGFESPGPAYRRWVARRWAAVGAKALRVAVVARAEHICPQKTGLLIAAEEGLDAHVCLDEGQALAWLDEASPAVPASPEATGPLEGSRPPLVRP